MLIAKVVIDQNTNQIDRPFDYKVPKELASALRPGVAVEVPFGRGNRNKLGYILSVEEIIESKYRLKSLQSVAKEESFLSEEQMGLALWIKKHYACRYIEAIGIVGPPKAYMKVKPPKKVWIMRQVNRQAIEDILKELPSNRRVQRKILQVFLEVEKIDWSILKRELDIEKNSLKGLEKKGLLKILEVEGSFPKTILNNQKEEKPLKLLNEQMEAFLFLKKRLHQNHGSHEKPYLIHGVTGSGKTEVYLQLMGEMISQGKTGIILVPEISLTPQTLERFIDRFGNRISLFHSGLTIKERYWEWKKVVEGQSKIVIGPRSAVFAPLKNLGLIVIDEEHEPSYKSEQTPKYHAREIAEYRCQVEGAMLVLGSATPSLESYYRGKNKEIDIIHLNTRATDHQLPKVVKVNMKEELQKGNWGMLSEVLVKKVGERLLRQEQVILFLNRRGYASYLTCKSCGYVQDCDHCEVSMTYHIESNSLLCHYCGHKATPIKQCPECKEGKLKQVGKGTQKLEEVLEKIFPQAKLGRMDTDALKEKGAYQKTLTAFKKGELDILIGTQMIAKGLDFPNVTLVGILSGDSSLHLPDFRASERTFQLLTQVSGRAGRGKTEGEVVLQTYKPEHYSIEAAFKQDYESFYSQEIIMRELFRYPPVYKLYMINFMGEDENEVKEKALRVGEAIRYILSSEAPGCSLEEVVLGPNPSVIGKINRSFRYRIILKNIGVNEKLLKKIMKYVCINKRDKYLSDGVNISLDFNPYNMM